MVCKGNETHRKVLVIPRNTTEKGENLSVVFRVFRGPCVATAYQGKGMISLGRALHRPVISVTLISQRGEAILPVAKRSAALE